jgi:hypothetical protein
MKAPETLEELIRHLKMNIHKNSSDNAEVLKLYRDEGETLLRHLVDIPYTNTITCAHCTHYGIAKSDRPCCACDNLYSEFERACY